MNKKLLQALLSLKHLLFFIFLCQPAYSIEIMEDVYVHGFLTQGAFYTSENNYNGESDGQFSFEQTEIGLNAFWQANEKIDFSAQILYRQAGAVESGDIRLDYGMMDINLFNNIDNQVGLRLGRIKNAIGLYNETRDVAFTTPSILLPQSIYLERSRSLFVSADGAHIYSKHQLADGWLSFDFGYGLMQNDNDEIQKLMFGPIAQGELQAEDASFMGQIKYNIQSDKYIFALSYADLTLDYTPGTYDPIAAGTARFSPYVLSAQYNGEKIGLTAEYYYSRNQFRDFGPYSPDYTPITTNWYLQGSYRLTPKWQTILRYDVNYLNKDDKSGSVFEQIGLPAHMGFTKDWMIGLRWDISPSLMIRGEYHTINGTSWLSSADNKDRHATEQYWDLFALQISYRF